MSRRWSLGIGLLAAMGLATGAARAGDADVVFTADHPGGVYRLSETVGWTLDAPLGLGAQVFDYVITRDQQAPIRTGRIDLSSGRGRIEVKLDRPGMVYVRLTHVAEPNTGAAPTPPKPEPSPFDLDRLTVGAAVAPEAFRPSAPRPADFDRFWSGQLARLKAIPINPVLTPAQSPRPGVELSTVRLDSVGSHVQGYLARPKRPGRFPALLIYQYAGVYPLQPDTAAARAAEGWLAFDVDSHDMAPDQATAPKDYQKLGDTSRDQSYFLTMYLRDTRALDYIRSRPDWDGRVVVVMGTSMGGQQSLVTAGLNPGRITAVLVNEPSGADALGRLAGRKAGYPGWRVEDPAVAATAPYFDTVNFASRIQAPTLAAMGFIDTVAPAAGILTAFDQIPAPKEAAPLVESDHNNITPQKQGLIYRRMRQALDALRTRGTFTPDAGWFARAAAPGRSAERP